MTHCMHIEEITLDGFKSYQKRTIIGQLSHQFNAVTGLNGSGKSNILDAICFVMGIKSLTQMRVNKMDELVYKQGQAGTTKASVTLVFNNEEKETSPPMYRDKNRISLTRQIIVGGRDRYLLNGHNAKPSDILNMFMSVQLNVNNPHFLIMQGRITKVINMKPKEMLGLIEEAAGTRMYEAKRLESAKKISRKQCKLEEIERVLTEDIETALVQLRQERHDYNLWSSLNRQIEDLERMSVTMTYYRDFNMLKEGKTNLDAEDEKRTELTDRLTNLQKDSQNIDSLLEEQQQLSCQHEGPLKELRSSLKEKEKERVKAASILSETKKQLAKTEKSIHDAETTYQNIKLEIEKLRNDSDTEKQLKEDGILHEAVESTRSELTEAENLLAALRTGNEAASGEDGNAALSLRGRLMEAKSSLASLKGEEGSLKVSITKWQKEVKEMQKKITTGNKEMDTLTSEITAKQSQSISIEKELKSLSFDQKNIKDIKEEITQTNKKLVSLVDLENSRFTALRDALDVHRRFDKNEVMGPVFELFRVKETHVNYCLALEECGKSKLFNIVVRDDGVGQTVLEQSKKRITCIPLLKIVAPDPPTDKLQRAKKTLNIAANNCSSICLPSEAIEAADKSYSVVLNYVFGSAILCKTNDMAKKVSHDQNIKALTITESGDVYNPQGTVSGGSKVGLNKLIESFTEYSALRNDVVGLNNRLKDLGDEEVNMSKTQTKYCKLSDALATLKIDLSGLEERLKRVREQSGRGHIDELEKQVADGGVRLEEISREMSSFDGKIGQLEMQINEFKTSKAEMTESLQKRITRARKDLKNAEAKLRTHREAIAGIREKDSVLERQLSDANVNVTTTQTKAEEDRQALTELQEEYHKREASNTELKTQISEMEKELKDEITELQNLTKEKLNIEQQTGVLDAQIKKMNHQFLNLKKSVIERDRRRQQLEKQHPWLREEIRVLQTNSASTLDFKGKTVEGIQDEMRKLENDRLGLQKKINRKVINMLETAEKEFEDLKTKRQRVVQDKESIEAFMRDLDEKKNVALDTCWREVNGYLESIFSTLLPGTSACLCELEGQPFNDGLQMKVAFGSVWKNSLTELSGGQRSLLALSLILALLKYKPAPLYILDEVDAALDLSHTQNIGQMIAEHFSGSQFIIVSLKDNLFNYADVLFKTAFVEGNSTVTRTENRERRKDAKHIANGPKDGKGKENDGTTRKIGQKTQRT